MSDTPPKPGPPKGLLFYDYVPDYLEARTPYRPAHLAHAKKWHTAGKLESVGTTNNPPTGGLFVFTVYDPAALAEFVASDPYVQNGIVAGTRIAPWNVVAL